MDAVKRAPSAFRYMDDTSLALVIELQQKDGMSLADLGKGKQREGKCTKAGLALQLYLDELTEAAQFALARRMTGSIQMVIREDADTLVQLVNEEQNAQTDRSMSVALSRGEETAPTIPSEAADDL
ncbi:ibr domain-containing protein [Seiridium cupressi]